MSKTQRSVQASEPKQFYRSPGLVAFFTFISGGLYAFYWFFRHWSTILATTPGRVVLSILASMNYIITGFSLFRVIMNNGRNGTKKHNLLHPSFAYLMLILAVTLSLVSLFFSESNLIVYFAITVISMLLLTWVLYDAQKFVNKASNAKRRSRYSGGEISFIVSGLLLVVVTVWVLSSPNIFPKLSDEDSLAQTRLYTKSQVMQKQYDACIAELNKEYEVLDYADNEQVASYEKKALYCEQVRLEQNKAAEDANKMLYGMFSSFFD